jgi:pimeloyl-ACP methyl ester carboxylesterase
MEDACNTSADNQAKYLVPTPLRAPCAPPYQAAFGSFVTDWDEIDTVVTFIRSLRGQRDLKINLVGWSRGGMRAIGYAALHPRNVDKIVALAPTRFPPGAVVPGYPMTMTDRRDFFVDWTGRSIPECARSNWSPRFAKPSGNRRWPRTRSDASGARQVFGGLRRSPRPVGTRTFPAAFARQRS